MSALVAYEPTQDSEVLAIAQFYLGLPGRFQQILALCRPVLEQVYKDEKQDAPPPDIFSLFKLSGFGVKDPLENPVQ